MKGPKFEFACIPQSKTQKKKNRRCKTKEQGRQQSIYTTDFLYYIMSTYLQLQEINRLHTLCTT